METITIVNPISQARVEGFIRNALLWIAKDHANIAWLELELEWLNENPNAATPEWIAQRRQWAEGLLADYQEDLRKDTEHLEELKKVLSEIEKPLKEVA